MRLGWAMALVAMVGCAEIIGADFGDRTLRPGAGGDGLGAAGAGASGAGSGTAGAGGEGGELPIGGACPGECVTLPDGWSGPVVALLDKPTSDVVACEDAADTLQLAVQANDVLSWQPASCAQCSCDDNSAVICGDVTIKAFASMTDCMDDVSCGQISIGEGSCEAFSGCSGGIFALKHGGSASANGSCPPSPDTPNPVVSLPEVSWGRTLYGCAANAAFQGCGAGEECLPSTARDNGGVGPCVFALGSVADCPEGFDTRVEAYQGTDEQRSCSDCGCGPPTCGGPNGDILMHYGPTCMGMGTQTPAGPSNTCFSVTPAGNDIDWIGSGCDPVGGQAQGMVTPDEPVTFCCRP